MGRKQEEEKAKMEQMRIDSKKRKERSMQIQSTEFTKLQLKAVNGAIKNEIYKTHTPDEDGNFYVDAYANVDSEKQSGNGDESKDEQKEDNDAKNEDVVDLNAEVDEEEEYEESSEDEKEREPSPEPVIELTAEELAVLEAERKKKETEELAKRTKNELKYRR